jgi:hypothetical protein
MAAYLLSAPSSSKSWAIMSCAVEHTGVRVTTTHRERVTQTGTRALDGRMPSAAATPHLSS